MESTLIRLGIDVGSTTVKIVAIDGDNQVIFSEYDRHLSNIFEKVTEMLKTVYSRLGDIRLHIAVTGSGGLAMTQVLGLPFEQEVITCSRAVETFIPQTDVVIELGGEDAKITFYKPSIEQRMNGTCAGGTGAFIDQMAVLLNTDSAGLNEMAKDSTIIYPIAARCGVFAKTDIQPLLNEGAKKEDIAASIFQAVVNQTITGLACGRTIEGNVAFLGGPLHFLSELRKRFIITLGLSESQTLVPEDSHFYVALGAALLSEKYPVVSLRQILEKATTTPRAALSETQTLEPLFQDEKEYQAFRRRHQQSVAPRGELREARGPVFLGIDAGSTTTKAALIDREGRLLYSFYKNNEGSPLDATGEMLRDLYEKLPGDAYIAKAISTGYGEALVQAAYGVDGGEIETMAHFRGARNFTPDVDFILDIGGQDMKCMMIQDGFIHNIMLNEACSSGCGSFIETYAKSMDMSVEDFAKEAVTSHHPVDLGTRCTVFMNSKVKQSQKEGASIGDISAGLSYSVIKNALYKVIKLRNPDEAGKHVVVQGGTFLNEAVLRSIEKIMGREVIRPDISGIMGAYGAALIGRERWQEGEVSGLIRPEALAGFEAKVATTRCHRCENRCLLTINTFPGGRRFITGNRCEKGAGGQEAGQEVPNLYEYKYRRLFDYEPLSEEKAPRGTIGIPRVLNMYENYPFWFTVLTSLGFRVIVSPHSSKAIYDMGIETISSDTACYPAKMVHGHVKWLAKNGVKHIFYPSVNYEVLEDETANNHYNCPIVATYPEVIKNNMDETFEAEGVFFDHPFMPYDDKAKLAKRLVRVFDRYQVTQAEAKKAVELGMKEDARFKEEIRQKADQILEQCREEGRRAIILAGRPYHLDPEINHGIDKIITSYGMAVLTEDSVAHHARLPRPLRVLDQWAYHTRLYRAAEFASDHDNVDLIQINSFGCGLDAITTDQVKEILEANNKLYTLIKIDEGENLGAARIRIRSLKVALEDREKNGIRPVRSGAPLVKRVYFTKEMKKRHTIIVPQMAPYHFRILEAALQSEGYRLKILEKVTKNDIEAGLKYINNDACYPTIVSLGQIINALQSGEYDLDNTSVVMSQTGGGCRASNYIGMLRKAFKEIGCSQVPIISVNYVGLEKNPGFKITYNVIVKAVISILYGDLITKLLYRVRPYEKVKGSSDALYEKWNVKMMENAANGSFSQFNKIIKEMIRDFENLEIEGKRKPRVGVVGEILVKYHPGANNDIVRVIEEEGGEAVVPGMFDFFLYTMYNKRFNYEFLAGKLSTKLINDFARNVAEKIRDRIRKELKDSQRFSNYERIEELAERSQNILSMGSQCGEGWLLTAEMMELMDSGVENIVCLQPFACLPNHVTGKGMIKPLRKYNRFANIAAIDFDPGASQVNQLNRIKLMMATAFKNQQIKEREAGMDHGAAEVVKVKFEEERTNESSYHSAWT